MRIISNEPDRGLYCEIDGVNVELERGERGYPDHYQWYARVIDHDGEHMFDGWIDDSSGYSTVKAMKEALDGAELCYENIDFSLIK